jgi:hypothetical protein
LKKDVIARSAATKQSPTDNAKLRRHCEGGTTEANPFIIMSYELKNVKAINKMFSVVDCFVALAMTEKPEELRSTLFPLCNPVQG